MTDVLIAGGGIGGLTAALTLHARGIDSTVLERASQLRPLGVGINLLPHAVSELHELGLGDELSRVAVAATSSSYFDTEGKLLFREPRGIDGGYGYPQYSVHRGQLQMLLLSALRERLGHPTPFAPALSCTTSTITVAGCGSAPRRATSRPMRWSAPTAFIPRCGHNCIMLNPTRCCGRACGCSGARHPAGSSTAERW
jgi:FAD binding domain-containing protein